VFPKHVFHGLNEGEGQLSVKAKPMTPACNSQSFHSHCTAHRIGMASVGKRTKAMHIMAMVTHGAATAITNRSHIEIVSGR
jgi:hypothetical protein